MSSIHCIPTVCAASISNWKIVRMSAIDNIKQAGAQLRAKAESVRYENRLSLPVIVLLFPTLTVIMAVAGFYVGQPITKGYGLLSFALCLAINLWSTDTRSQGIKRCLLWLAILIAGFLWSSVLFMNDATDAKNYHTPGTLLLASGWNPVLDATPEALQASMKIDLDLVHEIGLVHYARITWIWGAVTTLLTGNVSSSITSSFFLMICLCIYIVRFYRMMGGQSRLWSGLLVILILNRACVFYMLAGLADYVIYASLLMCVLTATAYLRAQKNEDLVLFGLSAVWLVNAKVSGLLFFIVLCAALMLAFVVRFILMTYEPSKVTRFACVVTAAGLLSLFAGSSPYLTNWFHFGGPAYPQQTFHPTRVAVDPIKADIAPDEDASFGKHVEKVVSAWFSETTVRMWHHLRAGRQSSETRVRSGEVFNGYGVGFKGLMCLSLIMVALSKRSEVDVAVGVIFLTAVCMPTYAIGVSRYAPQMWAIPFLAAANVMVRPGKILDACAAKLAEPGRAVVRYGILGFFCMVALTSIVRFGRYYVHLSIVAANKLEAYCEIQKRPFVEVLLADTRTSFSSPENQETTIRLCSNLETFYHTESFKAFGIPNVRFVHTGSVSLEQRAMPHQCLLFQDKGYLLMNVSKAEYNRWVEAEGKKVKDYSFADIKGIPSQAEQHLRSLAAYITRISRLRKTQWRNAWCRCDRDRL